MSPTLITFENVQLGIKCSNLHLCPGLHAAAKIAIFRVLRKIASLTIFRASCNFLQFFVMLIITEVQSELSI